jgi:hypothetical protein
MFSILLANWFTNIDKLTISIEGKVNQTAIRNLILVALAVD